MLIDIYGAGWVSRRARRTTGTLPGGGGGGVGCSCQELCSKAVKCIVKGKNASHTDV